MNAPAETSPYDRWLRYFSDRHGEELYAPLEEPFVERPGREAMARSLARFELGESGDGANLKSLVSTTGDAAYSRAIELFVAEENTHAEWLEMLRSRFGGEKLTSHWSDSAFVLLRHIGGLRREICVLLTAELVALTYYRILPLAYEDPALAAACKRILRDERGHVAFHRATLSREFSGMPAPARSAAIISWRSFVATTAAIVAWDHRDVLELAGVSRPEFTAEVRENARRLARAIRSPHLLRQEPAAAIRTR